MQEELRAQIKTSLMAGDRFRTETLKMVFTALQYAQIAKGSELSDTDSVAVMQKEIKKRKEAAEMYRKGDSAERADKEEKEIVILSEFVPTMLGGDELKEAVLKQLESLDAPITFPIAMKACIDALGNVDKAELASILKTKLG